MARRFRFPVMKLCERQLRDINAEDVLNDGLYRKCNIYKGGGGYDKFCEIYKKRTGADGELNWQFVVQLKGCPLRCPYCYVTRDGVENGECVNMRGMDMVWDFMQSELNVFHLMGGAPALYIEHWHEIIDSMEDDKVFHSDLLLVEKAYDKDVISNLAGYKNSLHAVSIKGGSPAEFRANTGVALKEQLFWDNFDTIVECGLPFYLTYTGMKEHSINFFKQQVIARYGSKVLEDSFAIKLVEYEALK